MGLSAAGVAVLIGVLVVATVAGLVLRRRDGRVTQGKGTGNGWDLAGIDPDPADRVLLLQLSSPVCTPCARTREQLTALTAEHPDLRHVEVDVAEHPGIARVLHVLRTPTTVAFDRAGTELLRVGGVPRRADLQALSLEETR
ncbi:TlpA family protein disulfide reductase [Actinomycetospora chibensis]|uniref:TlpA family protein disulfide reductase n=1 Tax=Actinomycetospora chibensis TaxID=663606 RepID=A0ABV9RKE2_9PSEU|nr:thioredoxin family protein [Actinomycetospora chibensis]MDD7923881.1 thioredoxin family protein [Actinomycetospora chibensis]